jgi:enoyl-CoA hydratase/carnithine racemase
MSITIGLTCALAIASCMTFANSRSINTTLACAQLMADGAPLSVRQSKKAIHQGLQGDLRSGLNYEVAAYMPLIHTQDRREGTLAFNEKRKPRFTGA